MTWKRGQALVAFHVTEKKEGVGRDASAIHASAIPATEWNEPVPETSFQQQHPLPCDLLRAVLVRGDELIKVNAACMPARIPRLLVKSCRTLVVNK
jgi:hypothetical protein